MRKVKIDSLTAPDNDRDKPYKFRNEYSFHPGDGRILFFKSERKSKAFINSYNRMINLCLVDLNDLLAELYCMYRSNWFYLDGKHYEIARTCNECIDLFEHLLSKSCSDMSSGKAHRVYSAIHSCVGAGCKICDLLTDLQTSRSNYYEVRLYQTKRARLQLVSERVIKWIDENYSFSLAH